MAINLTHETIKKRIYELYGGDDKQLSVIFSESPRVLVEAPAGYGKTRTMIGRIAYLLSTKKIPNPKKALGLTFSINAALNIKREVADELPKILDDSENNPILKKVDVTNYHGLCRQILKKYGYLISDELRKDINFFLTIDENSIWKKRQDWQSIMSDDEIDYLHDISNLIKNADKIEIQHILRYNKIIKHNLLPKNYITYNAIILMVIELFHEFKEVKQFYQQYYPLIMVDEFQDTNIIAWNLLDCLITPKTQLLLLGDPLQRIYGFIGAIPDIMERAKKDYSLEKVVLDQNYRFKDNRNMLLLDKNLRLNATYDFNPNIPREQTALVPILASNSQEDEATQIVLKIQDILNYSDDSVAVIVRNRNPSTDTIEKTLRDNGIDYFYGLFNDDDIAYVNFHNDCLKTFNADFSGSKVITKISLNRFCDKIKRLYASKSNKYYDSLIKLLEAFIQKLSVDYATLNTEDKFTLIKETFENRQLKQSMEYVKSDVILTTIHSAKGLEWDYVFVPDMEKFIQTYACFDCPNINQHIYDICLFPKGSIDLTDKFQRKYNDEFCVFYVAMTRARKKVVVSYSRQRTNRKGKLISNGQACCFLSLTGIRPNKINEKLTE